MMEAESQAVLNALTEHDFQEGIKKIIAVSGKVHTLGRGLLRG
jgi:hypothetical protein